MLLGGTVASCLDREVTKVRTFEFDSMDWRRMTRLEIGLDSKLDSMKWKWIRLDGVSRSSKLDAMEWKWDST